jgi:hypothetical protein
MRRWLFAGLLLAFGCGRAMPSDRPLGLGPTAEQDLKRAARVERLEALARSRDASQGRDEPEAAAASGDDDDDRDAGAESVDATADAGADAAADSGSDSGSPSTAFAFAGEYYGEDASTTRLKGFPESTQRDPKARTRVEQSSPSEIVLVIVDSARGTPLCSLNARIQGSRAVVSPNQSCFDQELPNVTIEGRVTSGTAVFDGARLELDLDVELTAEVAGHTLEGELEYHFEGERR